MRSSLSSLQVLAELLTVPLFTSRFSRRHSFTEPRSPTDVTQSLSARSMFWDPPPPPRDPRSLTGELSRVLRSSTRSVTDTVRSLNSRSLTGRPPRKPRSLPGELSRVLWSSQCRRRLRSFTAGNDSVTTLDAELLRCNFCSLEVGTVTSAAVSLTGNRF